jgi:protocatechuate 3,4-dioxygenase beta subunit
MTPPQPDAEPTAAARAVPMGRRRALTLLAGAGASVVALAACGRSGGDSTAATTTSTTAAQPGGPPGGAAPSDASSGSTSDDGTIPEETAGPYPGDGSNGPNVLTQDGVVRKDIRSSFGGASGTADGVPLTIDLEIVDTGGSPLPGAAVYVWHCDREGRYSMYGDITDENYLRGVQVADADGRLAFTSIFPGAYSGRWPHIHFEVYPDEAEATSAGTPAATSQIALPEDVCAEVYATTGYEQSVTNLSRSSLASDNVFGDDGGVEQLAAMSGDVDSGLTASLTVPV